METKNLPDRVRVETTTVRNVFAWYVYTDHAATPEEVLAFWREDMCAYDDEIEALRTLVTEFWDAPCTLVTTLDRHSLNIDIYVNDGAPIFGLDSIHTFGEGEEDVPPAFILPSRVIVDTLPQF